MRLILGIVVLLGMFAGVASAGVTRHGKCSKESESKVHQYVVKGDGYCMAEIVRCEGGEWRLYDGTRRPAYAKHCGPVKEPTCPSKMLLVVQMNASDSAFDLTKILDRLGSNFDNIEYQIHGDGTGAHGIVNIEFHGTPWFENPYVLGTKNAQSVTRERYAKGWLKDPRVTRVEVCPGSPEMPSVTGSN